MPIPHAFWAQEAKEPAHKRIKNALLAAGETPHGKQNQKKKKSTRKNNQKSSKHGHPFKGDKESNPKVKNFIHKRMHEFKEGKMHSRVKKTGPTVHNPKQAIAIALSESRAKGARIPKKNK